MTFRNHGRVRVLGALVLMGAAMSCVGAREARAQARPESSGQRTGVVTGTVRDTLGGPIAGATIVVGGINRSVTDADGRFALRGLARGELAIVVRRLGFEPLTTHVVVGDAPIAIALHLVPVAELLPEVVVHARPQPYESRLAGYNARREKKLGYYITREEIDRRNDMNLTAALRRIPGVRPYTMPGALGRSVRLPGSNCQPLVFVDGFPAALGSFDLDMIDLQGVEGVEVYVRGASIPADFAGPYGSEACGVIAIWSRPLRPRAVSPDDGKPVDVSALVSRGDVYLPDLLDVQPVFEPGSAVPAYPDSLFRAGVQGRVVAQFVVDTAGDVESGTVSIVTATHPDFGTAVRAALPSARFVPGRRDGRVVRVLLTMPFEFDPSTAPRVTPSP